MAISFIITQQPLNGTVTKLGTDPAKWLYTPNTGFTGGDTFKFRAIDGGRQSNEASVTVVVAPYPLMEWTLFGPTEQVTTGDHLLFCPSDGSKRLLEVTAVVSAIVNGAPGTYGEEQESRIKVEVFKVNTANQETAMMLQPRQISGNGLTAVLDLVTSTVAVGSCVHVRVTQKVGDVRGLKLSLRAQPI